MEEKQQEKIGNCYSVICDGYSEEENGFICQSEMDVPEDDCYIIVPVEADMMPGEVYDVIITGVSGSNLKGEMKDSI